MKTRITVAVLAVLLVATGGAGAQTGPEPVPGRYIASIQVDGGTHHECGTAWAEEVEFRPGVEKVDAGLILGMRLKVAPDGTVAGNFLYRTWSAMIELRGKVTERGYAGPYDANILGERCWGSWSLIRK